MNDETELDETVLEQLERMVGLDVFDEIVELFLKNAPKRVDAARAGLKSNQLRDVFHAMHSLKSSAAMLGAMRLTQIAERIERLATDESAEPLGRQIDDLAAELARVETLLQENRRGRSA